MSSLRDTLSKDVPPAIRVSLPRLVASRCPLIGYLSLSSYLQTKIFPSVDVLIRLTLTYKLDRLSYLTHISFVMASLWKYSSIAETAI